MIPSNLAASDPYSRRHSCELNIAAFAQSSTSEPSNSLGSMFSSRSLCYEDVHDVHRVHHLKLCEMKETHDAKTHGHPRSPNSLDKYGI